MWIPGTLSPETVRWCAEKAYPYFGLGTSLGPTCDLWDYYADEAAKHGYEAGSENFGYVLPTFVAETEDRAQELGKNFLFGGGQNSFARVEHTLPPGYNSKEAIRKLARQPQGSWLGISGDKMRGQTEDVEIDPAAIRAKLIPGYQKAQKAIQLVIGTPKSVIPKLKAILTVLRPGALVIFSVQGPVANADRQTSMRLIAQEIIPALKEHSKSIGLLDAFERAPGSVKLTAGTSRGPVSDRGPLKELGLA
jgi:alkanesulfonate monooxygenase SsuD/methylene tetrahydromethanopterin reductase-like flavin-dependent oxidoreductase (luciferase family)